MRSKPRDRYFNFWNFFSAFVVPDSDHVDEVEGILITSMQTEKPCGAKNSSGFKCQRVSAIFF